LTTFQFSIIAFGKSIVEERLPSLPSWPS
jgi:hypothetical protein